MKTDYLQPFIKRIRKSETNFHQFLRLHRAEYGHSFKKKLKAMIITDTIQIFQIY